MLAHGMPERIRPHFVDDPDSWFSDQRVRGSIWPWLVERDELLEFAAQAYEIGSDYQRRGRTMVADYFLGLAGAAAGEAEDRERRLESADSVDISIRLDETAPGDHRKDDIGTILARVFQLMDRFDSEDDVRHLWERVFVELSRQRDELRRRGRLP
jgi:hypothetical protein